MKIEDVGEFGLIERIKRILGEETIGDDTAPLKLGETTLLLTTDALNEGVHFLSSFPPEAVGWKAVSVNVSDIVASGGLPEVLLVSLNLPPKTELSYVERLYEGMKRACKFYNCRIVGGNIAKLERISISLFALGKTERFVPRSGAKPGETLFVSGTLGDSRAGLELLLMKKESYEPFELALIERHLRPTARIDYARHVSKYASASTDVSDGLLSDALHISERSSVRININTKNLPISRELQLFCKKYKKDPVEYALLGGEDYQLLFTHKRENWNPYLDMTPIGEVEEGKGVFVDGKPASEEGWRHF
ncbi:MAG: thiamine-phosphate kinase [Aquificae bacterium]|nr:thiamine-phosphate kinase [Aquificota bacterium]